MAITVTRLSDALGCEVGGIDLGARLDGAAFETLERAWLDHQVVLIRGQTLTTKQQIAFCSNFGTVQNQASRVQGGMDTEDDAVLYVSNLRDDAILPEGEMWFHSDQCYFELPTTATCLQAIEIPPEGGNTRFANTYAAYDALPDATRERIAGLRATNVYDYLRNPCKREVKARADAPRWSHPMVRTHPLTGRKALYICRLITESIDGMDRADSDTLLDELFDHMEQDRFVYEHRWRVGDVLIWDNRCTLHARTGFDPTARRELRRVAVEGEVPV